MRTQKVLEANKIQWFNDEHARLSYEMIFEEKGSRKTVAQAKKALEPREVDTEKRLYEALAERDKKWKIKVQNTKETAWQEGYEAGRQQGLEEARAEMKEKLSFLESTLEAAHQEWKKRQEMLDPGLLDIAFEICETILGAPVEHPRTTRKTGTLSWPYFRTN